MNMRRAATIGSAAIVVAIAIIVGVAVTSSETAAGQPEGSVIAFSDVKRQTLEFHAYNRSITLTSEQHEVMREALTAIKAPCCSDRSALTCCCECNMAKSWWGLSKHLIADRGLGAEQVRVAVNEWLEFINPEGFSGDVCYTGGCGRPFRENGCGGMNENHVTF